MTHDREHTVVVEPANDDPELHAKVMALVGPVGDLLSGNEPEVVLNVLSYFTADVLAVTCCPSCRIKAMAGISDHILTMAARRAGAERSCTSVH